VPRDAATRSANIPRIIQGIEDMLRLSDREEAKKFFVSILQRRYRRDFWQLSAGLHKSRQNPPNWPNRVQVSSIPEFSSTPKERFVFDIHRGNIECAPAVVEEKINTAECIDFQPG